CPCLETHASFRPLRNKSITPQSALWMTLRIGLEALRIFGVRDPPSWLAGPAKGTKELLDFDFGASGLHLLLDLFGFRLGSTLLEGLRSAFHELLGFGKAEARNNSADFLDGVDLVRAAVHEDDVELGLLSGRSSGSTTTSRSSGSNGHRSRGANAPLGFKGL